MSRVTGLTMCDPREPSAVHFGLDPVFTACAKLYIHELLHLPESSQQKGVYVYRGRPLMSVDVVGRVVHVHRTHRLTKYQVDDGTGVVSVVCWPADPQDTTSDFDMHGLLGGCLHEKQQSLLAEREDKLEPYTLGDLVHVQGRVKDMYGHREISANHHKKLDNSMEEVLRLAELPRIYTEVYSQSTLLPPRLKQQLQHGESADERHAQARLAGKAEAVLLSAMIAAPPDTEFEARQLPHHFLSFFEQEVISDAKAQNNIIECAVTALLKKGHLFSTNRHTSVYKLVSRCSSLKQAVRGVINEHTNKSNSTELEGCHLFAIYHKLRGRANFAHISKDVVRECLSHMEADSDVISTAQNCYVTFDG